MQLRKPMNLRTPIQTAQANFRARSSFSLPLNDAGAGAVYLTPLVAGGSSTPTFTRAGATAYTRNSSGNWIGPIGANVARSYYSSGGIYLGYLSEGARTQYLGATSSPATQTTASLGTGTYTLWIEGSGSATSSAGTATITGGGAATAGSPNTFTVTVAGTVTVTVSGSPTLFQLENGAFPSSYIANAGAAGTSVTRAADSLTYASAGNIDGTKGTAYAEVTTYRPDAASVNPRVIDTGDAGVSVPLFFEQTTRKVALYDGNANAVGTAATFPITSAAKIASTWAGTTASLALNGTITSGQAFDGNLNVATTIGIGNRSSGGAAGNELFGTIRNVKIWTRALSDGQIAAI